MNSQCTNREEGRGGEGDNGTRERESEREGGEAKKVPVRERVREDTTWICEDRGWVDESVGERERGERERG